MTDEPCTECGLMYDDHQDHCSQSPPNRLTALRAERDSLATRCAQWGKDWEVLGAKHAAEIVERGQMIVALETERDSLAAQLAVTCEGLKPFAELPQPHASRPDSDLFKVGHPSDGTYLGEVSASNLRTAARIVSTLPETGKALLEVVEAAKKRTMHSLGCNSIRQRASRYGDKPGPCNCGTQELKDALSNLRGGGR